MSNGVTISAGTNLSTISIVGLGSMGGGTGLNSYPNSSWNNLTFATTTSWIVNSGVIEDRRILYLTGNSTLSFSGLYNGWAGLLETVQSGSGYNLTLPAGTKVPYNGAGSISLTTGISGATDMIGFAYDGTTLFANIINYFT